MLNRRKTLFGLGGGLVLPAVLAGLDGLPAAFARAAAGSRQVQRSLTLREAAFVAAIAEGIIPQTDTPGAIGAGVPAFIGLIYSEWFFPEEQVAFRHGLKMLETDSVATMGKAFAECSASQRETLLNKWDAQAMAARAAQKSSLPSFAQIKALTVVGYYTSQVGQEQELHTDMDAGEADPNGPVMIPVPFRL